jgi:hypothetical protein
MTPSFKMGIIFKIGMVICVGMVLNVGMALILWSVMVIVLRDAWQIAQAVLVRGCRI